MIERYGCEHLNQILIVARAESFFIEHFCDFFVKSAFLHYCYAVRYSSFFFFMTEDTIFLNYIIVLDITIRSHLPFSGPAYRGFTLTDHNHFYGVYNA